MEWTKGVSPSSHNIAYIYIYMSEFADVIDKLLVSGLEGAGMVLLMVLSYKLYKMKIKTHSKCCGDNVEVMTQNSGAGDDEEDEVKV